MTATPDRSDGFYQSLGFPLLTKVEDKATSDETNDYNCIAHAFGDDKNWWWPNGLPHGGHDSNTQYWPVASANMSPMEAFLDWLQKDGWVETKSTKFEPGVTRIALYVETPDQPTHAARQLNDKEWTSKLGELIDLSHELPDIEGPLYGNVWGYFEKRTIASTASQPPSSQSPNAS